MTGIKGKFEFRSTTPLLRTAKLQDTRPSKRTETMALVLNNTAVTTTTPSFTGPIPSPGPFSFLSGNSSRSCSKGNIFTYSNAYPIPHCIHSRSGEVATQRMGFLDSSASRFDSVILDDDALTSLILDMELDKVSVLPELQVVNADLTDCNVLTRNRQQAS